MPSNWSRGYTKETHLSVLKISKTFKNKKLDNFSEWREKMKKSGKIRSYYPELEKDGDLAELIGVILGDGHIRKFPRTEELSIFSNASNKGFVKRYAKLVEEKFQHKPAITKHGENCTRIRIYEKFISKRLNIPFSPRGKLFFKVPRWILNDKEFVVRYLRGLYEAEGCFCIHKPTYTYKALFSNRNQSFLDIVFRLLKKMGFHPHKSLYQIQISKKAEVASLKDLIEFRKY